MLEDRSHDCSDPLFMTRKRELLEIWNQMQRLQTDFAVAQELTFYYTATQWHSAKTVLDVGTGNGYYLDKIAQRFPDKTYHGIDLSAELVAIAEAESGRANVSFSRRELSQVTESFDFVLMRLLLQHLNDIPTLLDQLAMISRPGKSALIIDAHDPVRFFHPDLPQFTGFFTAYSDCERNAGRDRCVISRVKQALESSAVWQMGDILQLLIPSTIPGNLDFFTKTYSLLVDLVEHAGELSYDFSAVKDAWRQWSQRTEAYAQVGLNLIRIDRV